MACEFLHEGIVVQLLGPNIGPRQPIVRVCDVRFPSCQVQGARLATISVGLVPCISIHSPSFDIVNDSIFPLKKVRMGLAGASFRRRRRAHESPVSSSQR